MIYNTIIQNLEKNNRKVVLFFFIAFLLLSLFVVKDFGMSWDERYQRDNNGYANWDYVFHDKPQKLLTGEDKYHGPVFEIFLVAVEKVFHLNDLRSIYLMRHAFTFLLFYISSVFFYFLSLRIFKRVNIAFIGVLMYVLSPHIFSHSFYNSKDIVFLSLFTISIYTLLWFFEKQNILRASVLALVAAITIDVRIIGVLIPAFLLYGCIIDAGKNSFNRSTFKAYVIPALTFLVFLVVFTILFWPVLWLGPVHHFIEALKENSNYPWLAPVLYFGKEYIPTELPFHYLFFWMFISRPVIYSLLFIAGVFVLLVKFAKHPLKFIFEKRAGQLILFWFFLPLLAMIIFKSPTFDTGRHLYFLHGAFVLLSLYGVEAIFTIYKNRKVILFGFQSLLVISFGLVIFRMITLHPFEHLYFNMAMKKDMAYVKENFEFDYWGLTQRKTLEGLLAYDHSSQIMIQAENSPGELNSFLLKPEERKRLVYTKDMVGAKYLIADYRWKKETDYRFKKEINSTFIGNAKASTIFRVRSSEQLSKITSRLICSYSNDLEFESKDWSNTQRMIDVNAHSGKNVTKIDRNSMFSNTFQPQDLDALAGNKNLLLRTEMWILDSAKGASARLIISLQDTSDKVYFYESIYEITNNTEKKTTWQQVNQTIELPVIRSARDKLKIYLMNTGDNEICMDDIKFEFVEEQD